MARPARFTCRRANNAGEGTIASSKRFQKNRATAIQRAAAISMHATMSTTYRLPSRSPWNTGRLVDDAGGEAVRDGRLEIEEEPGPAAGKIAETAIVIQIARAAHRGRSSGQTISGIKAIATGRLRKVNCKAWLACRETTENQRFLLAAAAQQSYKMQALLSRLSTEKSGADNAVPVRCARPCEAVRDDRGHG
jgi:hypothetical protein